MTIIQPLFSKEDLIEAIYLEDYAAVEKIIQAGTPINFKDDEGRSPLSYAIHSGQLQLVQLLLDHGAEVSNTQDIVSPLLMSYLTGRTEIVKTLAPHILTDPNNVASSPLGIAIRNQDRETAKTFLKEIDNVEEKLNYSALHQAVENNDLNLAQAILNQSTLEQINRLDTFGYAPLHLAILNRHPEMVQLLMGHGADPHLATSNGQNAFDLANQKGMPEIVTILAEATTSDNLITQAQFEQLLSTQDFRKPNHLASLLEKQGFSSTLKGLKITDYFLPYSNDFTGINFIDCQFNGHFRKLDFQGAIENVTFHGFECTDCTFKPGTVIAHSTFQDSLFQGQFDQTTFSHNYFFYSTVKDSSFIHPTLHDNYIYGSHLWNIQLEDPLMKGLKIKESYLHEVQVYPEPQNDITTSTIEHTARTKPIIGTFGEITEIGDFSRPGFLASKPYLHIKQTGALPLLISHDHFFKTFDTPTLEQEVQFTLSHLPPESNESIVQSILHSNQPTINALNDLAKTYANTLNGLWIPGGPDIHPHFYGQFIPNNSEQRYWDYSYDLFEFALVDQMVKSGKPVLGICHGAQLLNVYFGGTLLQDVPGHRGVIQPVEVLNNSGRLGEDLNGKKVWGYSAHHQAIDKLADPLEKVAEYDGVIKAAQGKELPVFLSQFHPEYLLDDNNAALLNAFFDATKESVMLIPSDLFSEQTQPEVAPLTVPPPPAPLSEDLLHFFAQSTGWF